MTMFEVYRVEQIQRTSKVRVEAEDADQAVELAKTLRLAFWDDCDETDLAEEHFDVAELSE